MASVTHFFKKPDVGIFLFRLMGGILMIIFGVKNLMGGPSNWAYLGKVMDHLGIHFGYTFWGMMAGVIQAAGGLCFLLGLFFRLACLAIAFVMAMAVLFHLAQGEDILKQGALALLSFFIFFSYLFIGPGSLSVMKD